MERLDCQSARRLIHLKLDGELPQVDAELLAEHVEQCERCRTLQEELGRVDAALSEGLGAIEAPEPDVAAARQRVRKARRSNAVWSTWLPAAAAALLVLTLVLLGAPALDGPDSASAAPATVVSGGDAVHVFGPNERTAQSGTTGTELQESSVAWGLGDEPIALEFVGGARVELSNEAVVRIGRNSIDLFKGGLRVDLREAGEQFSVVTPWGEFTGAGSLFTVHSDANGGSARISVHEGDVRVISRGTERVLSEGEAATLQPDPTQTIAL